MDSIDPLEEEPQASETPREPEGLEPPPIPENIQKRREEELEEETGPPDPPKKKPRKPIEKIPCPKCGKKYSKQVLMYRTHKCEVPVFPDDDVAPAPAAPAAPAAPDDPAPAAPEPDSVPDPAPGPQETEKNDYDSEGRPFQPPLSSEALSLMFKQARDDKRAAKRRLYAQSMFG